MRISSPNPTVRGWLQRLFASITVAGLALVLGISYTVAQDQAAKPIIGVSASPSMVTFAGGTVKSAGRLKVRVDGPDGQTVYEATSDSGILDWVPQADLPDGQYQWDAWFVPQASLGRDDLVRDGAARTSKGANAATTHYRSGSFEIKSGALVMPEVGVDRDQASLSWPERALGAVLNAIVPTAAAAGSHNDSVAIEDAAGDNSTFVQLFNTGNDTAGLCNEDGNLEFYVNDFCIGSQQEMILQAGTGNLGLGTDNPTEPISILNNAPSIRFQDGNSSSDWSVLAGSAGFRVEENSNGFVDPLRIQTNSKNNSLFIESTGDIGLGTSTPTDPLHIVDSFPAIRLEDSGSSGDWLVGGSSLFLIQDRANLNFPLIIEQGAPQNSIRIQASGDIGLGTFGPDAPLHVKRSDGTAQVLVEETSGTAARRSLFALSNNGEVKFTMENRNRSETWDFSARSNGFNINLLGTGGQELLVTPAGEFQVGPGGTANFTVQPDGDVLVGGSIVHSSSRTTKHDITQVDDNVILSKLSRLDLAEWTYKKDVDGDRHLSPMAEDFYAAFGLGPDNKHVSPSDLAGVALAAAKALKAENAAKDKRIDALEARLRVLEARLDGQNDQ